MRKTLEFDIAIGSESLIGENNNQIRIAHRMTDDDSNPCIPDECSIIGLGITVDDIPTADSIYNSRDNTNPSGFALLVDKTDDTYAYIFYPGGVNAVDDNLLYQCKFVGGRPNVRRPS